MRPPILFAALLWLRGFSAEVSISFSPGPHLNMNITSQGRPTSLFLSWAVPEPGGFIHALCLTRLSPLSSPEGQQLQAHTKASSFEFQDLVPGSRYQLEVTPLRPCGQNVTVTLAARTGIRPTESQTLAHNISMPPGTLSYNFGDLLPGSDPCVSRSPGAAYPGYQGLASPRGAAWLHVVLIDLLGGTNLTAVVRRGVSHHTFLHLSPGTPHELTFSVAAGSSCTYFFVFFTDPSAPLDLVLTPLPTKLWASRQGGPGALDGFLLKLSGPVEKNITVGPEAYNVTFPGPLPTGHYALDLKVPAGPYGAWTQASAWLDDSAAQSRQGSDAKLQLDGLEASKEPRKRALLYMEGNLGLLGNISVPPGATHITFYGLVPGARYCVDIASSLGIITQSLTGHTSEYQALCSLALQLEGLARGGRSEQGRGSEELGRGHQRGSQKSPGSLVDLGPDNSSLTLRSLVPSSCCAVSVWAWAGNLNSSIQKIHICTFPAPPANLSLNLAIQPPALRASWSPPSVGREDFQVQLYSLRPLTLEREETLAAEIFSPFSPHPPYLALLAGLLAPPLVNVTSEGPTQLWASWVHASRGRDSYQVTLYQAGTQASTSAVGAKVASTSFLSLTLGTKYEVEVVMQAGTLHTVAANTSGWTPLRPPSELLVSRHASTTVVSLAWVSSPLRAHSLGEGRGSQLSEVGHLSWEHPRYVFPPGRDPFPWSASPRSPAYGECTDPHPTQSLLIPTEPGPVEDVQCQPEATFLALNWTVPAQLAAGGNAHLMGIHVNVSVFQADTSKNAVLLPSLVPATSYHLSLAVLGRNGLWIRSSLSSPSPAWHPPALAPAPELEPGTEMGVMIPQGILGKDVGQIQWYRIIATINMSHEYWPSGEAINHTWRDRYYRGHDSYLAVLLPNPFYPEPWAVLRSWTVPVGTEDCGHTKQMCNGQLKPGSQYRKAWHDPQGLWDKAMFHSSLLSAEPRASVPPAAVPLPVVEGLMAGCVLTICAVLEEGEGAENPFSQELTAYNLWTHWPIPIHSFRQSQEAKSAHAHQALFLEFEVRPLPPLGWAGGANTTKNRYPHVLPYDHSRVRLTWLDGEPHSDYINANFVPVREFIAPQGPLRKMPEDFWRLVWELQVRVIVMLTVGMKDGRVLCEHYWPADSTLVIRGHITIHLLAKEPEDEWTKREFQLQHMGREQQRVKQLWFTTWPNHSMLEAPSSLPAFMELVQEHARATQGMGPILVHCSVGMSRTGTFVALSRLLQQLEEEQVVGTFRAVCAPRMHRPLMIQAPSQYIFLHSCLLNKILEAPPNVSESWPISVMKFMQACAKRAASANAGFLKKYELLLQAIKDEAGSSTPPPGCKQDSPISCESHRGPCGEAGEPPDDMPEAWLFPRGPSGRDHVVLTGPAGPEELWKLVWQHGAHVLVSGCPPDATEKPQEFWPTEMQPIVTDMVTVHWVAESSTAGWLCTLFRVTHVGDSRKEREVQRLQFPYLEPGRELPATNLLPFLAAVGQCCSRGNSKKPGTLLSRSSKGTTQLGTFLAMEQLLQQAGSECTMDVFNVTLQWSQEQYIYLYNCLNSALADELP
uniref:protein-tyrosine-phosphatase n=1 Tax=Piliocolobus tephrosceles TaxID=591936 RepID=A0A8C9HZ51_9PRIM